VEAFRKKRLETFKKGLMPVSIILRSQQAKTLKRHPFLKHLRVRVDKGKRYENACVDENIFSYQVFGKMKRKLLKTI